jgi:hypothetical protein
MQHGHHIDHGLNCSDLAELSGSVRFLSSHGDWGCALDTCISRAAYCYISVLISNILVSQVQGHPKLRPSYDPATATIPLQRDSLQIALHNLPNRQKYLRKIRGVEDLRGGVDGSHSSEGRRMVWQWRKLCDLMNSQTESRCVES